MIEAVAEVLRVHPNTVSIGYLSLTYVGMAAVVLAIELAGIRLYRRAVG